MIKLTTRQKEILEFIDRAIRENGFPPTLREICKTFSISSTNGARYHIHRLKKMGYLDIDPGKSRGVKRVQNETETKKTKRPYQLPILGHIPAGPLNLAASDIREDELTVDPTFFSLRGKEEELFGLKVRGDSMIGAGIHDGDIVVVRTQNHAQDGDIVVARHEEEATVKRYRFTKDELLLEPANSAYQPIRIPNLGGEEYGQSVALIGIVVGVIRSL